MCRRHLIPVCLAVAALVGCADKGPALLAEVEVAFGVRATCLAVEALAEDGTVLSLVQFPATDLGPYRVAIYQGDLPREVDLRARALWGGDGCEAPLLSNGTGPVQRGEFQPEYVATVQLTVAPPDEALDADGDGFVAASHDGPDCRDDDANAHPAAKEDCHSLFDLNCDGNAGCQDASCSAHACAEPPTSFAFASEPVTVTAGECSPQLMLQAQNADGLPAVVAQDVPIHLQPDPAEGVTFFADASCTQAVTQPLLPARESSVGLHFRATRAGSLTLLATATGVGTAEQVQTVLAGPAQRLSFATPPRTVAAGACSDAVTVQVSDAHGNPVAALADVDITLTYSEGAALSLFQDASCTQPLDTLTVHSGAAAATFHLQGVHAGLHDLTASAMGHAPGSQPVQILAGGPAGLTFTTPPQTLTAGTCSARVGVIAEDAYGNPIAPAMALTVSVVGSPVDGFTPFSDAGCTTPLTQLSLPTSGAEAGFYFRATRAGTLDLSATAQGLSPAEQAAQVQAAMPAKLRFLTAPQTLPALQCSSAATVQVTDAFDNPSATGAALSVNLAAQPAQGLTFYSDGACATPSQQIPVAQGGTDASLYFRADAAGQHTVEASATGLVPASQLQTFTPAAASLTFTTPAPTLWAGECSAAVGIELRDAQGAPVTVGSSTTVTLAAAPGAGFSFHSDSNCNTQVTSVNIPKNDPGTTFYVRGITGGTVTVTASALGFTDAPLQVTIRSAVQRGTCTLGYGADSVDCQLPHAVPDVSKAFVVVSTTSPSSYPERAMARCFLEDADTVRCTRRSTSVYGVNIRWQVAYLPRNVQVRHLQASCTSGGGDQTNVALSPKLGNTNRAFVLVSQDGVGTLLGPDDLATARLTADDNVRITRQGGDCANGARYALQVVEWTGANATRDGLAALTGTTLQQTGLAGVDPARSFLLYGWRTQVSGGAGICGRMVRGRITSNSALTFTRGCDVAGGVSALVWERVQLPLGNTVQAVDLTVSNGGWEATANLPTPVDRTRTLLLSGGQAFGGQSAGEGNSSDHYPGDMMGRISFDDDDTVRVQRGSLTGQATWTVQAVQLLP